MQHHEKAVEYYPSAGLLGVVWSGTHEFDSSFMGTHGLH